MYAAPATTPPPEPQAELLYLAKLAEDITELGAHIHAATARWLLMIAEFDRRKGWADWDCQSCAHWLSWRCGLSPNAARDHVRVARRLEEMPLTRAAFSGGRLSYSQVRALSRMVTPDNEEELLGIAEHATAAQIEMMAGAYRSVKRIEEVEREVEIERVLCDALSPLLRRRRWRFRHQSPAVSRGWRPGRSGAGGGQKGGHVSGKLRGVARTGPGRRGCGRSGRSRSREMGTRRGTRLRGVFPARVRRVRSVDSQQCGCPRRDGRNAPGGRAHATERRRSQPGRRPC